MEHPAFIALADANGWSREPFEAPNEAASNEWGLQYASPTARLLLIGSDRTERAPRGVQVTVWPAFRNCVAVFPQPAEGWRDAIAALADELGYRSASNEMSPVVKAPTGGEAGEWRRRDGFVGWAHDPTTGTLRLEVYRSLDTTLRFDRP